ncbi:putative tagatose 6-phosphate kinase gatZ domain protein [Escherichia coli 5905]|nr:putative tagatose 6-phosphate kinase gatZ domain protein [Escherichia coli 5905]PIS75155.1 hypothetical protein L241_13355 [Escherichia coli O55:H7 str. USDA 5905]
MKTLIARHKAGEHIGICSVCSAHPLVIEAALAFDRNSTRKVLIEAKLLAARKCGCGDGKIRRAGKGICSCWLQ